jgi:hypothetical protein
MRAAPCFFALYIQNSRLQRVIGTFLGNYIWQRISGLREIAEVWGLDKNFAGSGIKGNSKVKGDGHEYPSHTGYGRVYSKS